MSQLRPNRTRFSQLLLLVIFALVSTSIVVVVQNALADTGTGTVSLITSGSAVGEDFNTLSNTAGSTTNTVLPTGWYITETGGGARDNEQYAVDRLTPAALALVTLLVTAQPRLLIAR